MAIRTKAIRGSGLTKLRNTIGSQDGSLRTITETYLGPYAELLVKQNSVLYAKSTQLEPTEAGHGRLTVVLEAQLPEDSTTDSGRTTAIEVIWQELRKPIETHPYYESLTEEQVAKIKGALDLPAAEASAIISGLDSISRELYKDLSKGTTEYVIGVPLVRKTTTRVSGNTGGGNAWFRSTPPGDYPSGWDWLKTADERRREGRSYTQIEEWTAAKEWDERLYP